MLTDRRVNSTGKHCKMLALTLVLALGLGACSTTSKMTTGSIGSSGKPVEQMGSQELRGALQGLGKAYARKSKDKDIAMRYAAALQANGSNAQALAVMRKSAIDHPKDRGVLAAYGKALASNGDFEQALQAVQRAQTPEYPDWKLVSAEAAILDQLGNYDEARALYRKAIDMSPDEPSILSNLGMSFVLTGDLKTAETHMRKAAGMRGSDSRIRQNLALVVGLQGRFQEAEQIAGQELSLDQAQANITYLRSMLAQQNAWNDLKKEEKTRRN